LDNDGSSFFLVICFPSSSRQPRYGTFHVNLCCESTLIRLRFFLGGVRIARSPSAVIPYVLVTNALASMVRFRAGNCHITYLQHVVLTWWRIISCVALGLYFVIIRISVARALDAFFIDGIRHNIPFLASLMQHPRWQVGELSTGFIAEEFPEGFASRAPAGATALAIAAVAAAVSCARRAQAAGFPDRWRGDRWCARGCVPCGSGAPRSALRLHSKEAPSACGFSARLRNGFGRRRDWGR